MKKVIPILLFLAMCGAVVFFDYLLETYWPEKEPVNQYDEGYSDGYAWGHEEGYDEGRDEGYNEAMQDAPERIKDCVESDISDLNFYSLIEWEITPEEAVQVLTNYIDGELVSETDLNNAIWAIRYYYYEVDKIVDNIDDYPIG